MSSTQTQISQTYWCDECDMSIHLLKSTANTTTSSSNDTPLLCPQCHLEFLQLMDPTSDDPNNNSFLLDSPSFRRFIQHHFHHNTNINNSNKSCKDDNFSLSIDLPTIKITSSVLHQFDSLLVCAVCKDHFVVDVDDAKQLPCNHLFHPHCILPWLSIHPSCPLCRFHLPTPPPPPPHDDINNDNNEETEGNWERWLGFGIIPPPSSSSSSTST